MKPLYMFKKGCGGPASEWLRTEGNSTPKMVAIRTSTCKLNMHFNIAAVDKHRLLKKSIVTI